MLKKTIINNTAAIIQSSINEDWVFTISGQSNARGLGTGAPSESYLLGVIPRVFIWNGSSFDPLEYNVTNISNTDAHGIELNLGYLASQQTSGNIYIVKQAQNGTNLAVDWAAGSSLYNNLKNKTNNAVIDLQNQGKTPIYKGNMWIQGEADAQVESYSLDYASNLSDFETRLRADVTIMNESTPFIVHRLHSSLSYTYLSNVRTAQEGFTFTNGDDLTLHDGVHYDSASQNVIANRFLSLL